MASEKKEARLRRARKSRAKIREKRALRLCVTRTPQHIYAQIIAPDGNSVLVSASTVEKELRAAGAHGGNVTAAASIGKLIAERALAHGIAEVAFDRSGYKYHGRIKALADAAREGGLKF
jgi:large subunit ribosomal protein L18